MALPNTFLRNKEVSSYTSKYRGPIESSIGGNITRLDQQRLNINFSDVSNLDQKPNVCLQPTIKRGSTIILHIEAGPCIRTTIC